MTAFQRAAIALGLARPVPMDGFHLTEPPHRWPICDRCGAVVPLEAQPQHVAWHHTARH